MYLNVNLLKSRNLSLLDLQILQLAKQQRIEDVSDVLSNYSENVNVLLNLGYLESIKGKKVNNCTRDQVEQLALIIDELEDLRKE